ncbi:MAG: URC4/urg3 family protein [Calothrix sp. C42_A2020_038]|nr:URC4/urg3 family protein [Calothrix sp. C42_A2020_038]
MSTEITATGKADNELIAYLHSPTAIRSRCRQLFKRAVAGCSSHFDCDFKQLTPAADYVIDVIRSEYPDLQIPFHSRWRHFEAGGVARLQKLDDLLAQFSKQERAIAKFDLAIISVLLDAGAGSNWYYYESDTGMGFKRSEGLAVASFHMFCQGAFSTTIGDEASKVRVDAQKLQNFTETELIHWFQIRDDNPLVGVSGRLKLLQKLGTVLTAQPQFFGTNPRPGNLVNYLIGKVKNNQLSAATVFDAVLCSLSEIWPGRLKIATVNLGDVWHHPDVSEDGFVPFHKLSQWLTYSLLEPLQELGIEIIGLDELTGLPEYRNGGLCIDIGLLKPKHPDILRTSYPVASSVIVEWRALTVILLDQIAASIREKLNMSTIELPLVKILQGGTWTAGRKIAAELRADGASPIQIESDGTVL